MPPRPTTPNLADYLRLAATAWLDSPIRSGHRFRHAVGGSFDAHPAADAAWMMDQLAVLATDATLAGRLRTEAAAAAAEVPAGQSLHAAVSHVRYPIAPLVLGTAQKVSDPSSSSAAAGPVVASLDQAECALQGPGAAIRARWFNPLPGGKRGYRLRPHALFRRGQRSDRGAGLSPAGGCCVRG